MARQKKKGTFKDVITSKLKGNSVKEAAPSTPKKAEKKPEPVKVKKPEKVIVSKQSTTKKSESLEESEELLSDLRVVSKSKPTSCTDFECYFYIPEDRLITKNTDIGSRVIVAKYPLFYKIYFMEYIDIGKKYFPHGAIKVYNATFDQTQYFYYESVAIHPTKKDKYRVKNLDE
jgi:hypothetical protein